MVDIEAYMNNLQSRLQAHFGKKHLYLGLQGSYMRGEATEASDIDVMVVLDGLTPSDLEQYKAILHALPEPDKACGFLCGRQELMHWNALEICHLVHSTQDYWGRLCELVPSYTRRDIIQYVKVSMGNLYHELCHAYLHSDGSAFEQRFRNSMHTVFFMLQNILYLRTGSFLRSKAEMLRVAEGLDRRVLEQAMATEKTNPPIDMNVFSLLFSWCQQGLIRMDELG